MRRVAGVLVVLPALAGCGADRGDVPILIATTWDQTTAVMLTVESCNGEPRVEVVEGEEEVRLRVRADDGDDDCADGVLVCLDAPLGDRTVVDATTGGALVTTHIPDGAPEGNDCPPA